MFQFNKVGVHEVPAVTPEKFMGCELMQQIQKGPYPEAILQVSDSLVPNFFCILFLESSCLKVTMLDKERN